MNDQLNIHKLFEDLIEDDVFIEKQSNLQLKEQKRLEVIYSFNKDNIDDVFDSFVDGETEISDDQIGMKFGKWSILKVSTLAYKCKRYECQCECGTISHIVLKDLHSGKSTKCRKCRGLNNSILLTGVTKKRVAKSLNVIGSIINNSIIIDIMDNDKNNRIIVKVKCLSCIQERKVRLADLKRSKSNSCNLCKVRKPLHLYTYNKKYGDKNIIGIEIDKNIKGRALLSWICNKKHTGKTSLSDLRNGRDLNCRLCYLNNFEKILMSGIKVGSIFGSRTIIDITEKYNERISLKSNIIKKTRTVLTKCCCGKEKSIEINQLKSGKANRCLSCANKKINE